MGWIHPSRILTSGASFRLAGSLRLHCAPFIAWDLRSASFFPFRFVPSLNTPRFSAWYSQFQLPYSPGRAISAEFSILYFLTLICVVEFLVDARQHPPDWLQVIFVLRRIMLVLLGLVLLCLFISPAMVMTLTEGVGIRLSGSQVAPMGNVGAFIAIISAFTFLYSLERRSWSVICFLIGVAATIVTQARGAEIALLLCLAILGFGWAKTGKRIAYLFVAGSMVAVMFACLAVAIIGPDRIWNKFNRGQETEDMLTLSGRTEVWADVIDSSLSHPKGWATSQA